MPARNAARRILLVVGATVALSAASLATASAAEHGKPLLTENRVCASTPTVSKTGNWTCVAKKSYSVKAKSGTVTPAAGTTYSNSEGTWNRTSNTAEGFTSATIYYGDAEGVLGDGVFRVAWALSGTKISEKASFTNSSTVEYPEWAGYLSNGANDTLGTQIQTCETIEVPSEEPGGSHFDSPANWCTLTDNKNHDHGMFIDLSWEVAGQPGYWYTYAKSTVSHSATVPATSYAFDTVGTLELDPAGGGYDD